MGSPSLKKKVLFLTGTRADFGKLQPLMHAVENSSKYECFIFVTGMHTLSRYGYTTGEVEKAGFINIHTYMNQYHNEPMDLILANTIGGLSRYVQENIPDLIVIHGDRIETMAGAIVGILQNILVAHIEGGEISGTVDEIIRHSVSKLSHLHFVANEEAAIRLKQMGERPESIHVIGSPDIDIMLSSNLPTLEDVKSYYKISFDDYAIVIFHSVTTEIDQINNYIESFVSALIESKQNYIVIYPNNDEGSEIIFLEYEKIKNSSHFHLSPSFRFKYFLVLLKNAKFIIGNSSSGIREAPVYGIPTINVGTRQNNRSINPNIHNVANDKELILKEIHNIVKNGTKYKSSKHFGKGDSLHRFMEKLEEKKLWGTKKQKQFCDIPDELSTVKRHPEIKFE